MSKLIRNIIVAALIAGASSLSASDPAPASTTEAAAATATAPAAPVAPAAPTAASPPAKPKQSTAAKKAATPAAPAAPPKTTATVVTNEGLSEHCILATVVTEVDGKAVAAGDKVDTFEFAPGEHSISGYGGVDPTQCATFIGDSAVQIAADEHIGQSTLKFNVVAGKTYYVGLDVRKPEKNTWKLVVWQIKH